VQAGRLPTGRHVGHRIRVDHHTHADRDIDQRVPRELDTRLVVQRDGQEDELGSALIDQGAQQVQIRFQVVTKDGLDLPA